MPEVVCCGARSEGISRKAGIFRVDPPLSKTDTSSCHYGRRRPRLKPQPLITTTWVSQRASTNPRGVETKFVVNALDQKVVTISGGPLSDAIVLQQKWPPGTSKSETHWTTRKLAARRAEVSTFKYDEQDNFCGKHTRTRLDSAPWRVDIATTVPIAGLKRYSLRATEFSSITRSACSSTPRLAARSVDLASTTKVLYDDDGRKLSYRWPRNYTRYAYDTLAASRR